MNFYTISFQNIIHIAAISSWYNQDQLEEEGGEEQVERIEVEVEDGKLKGRMEREASKCAVTCQEEAVFLNNKVQHWPEGVICKH
jgi:hypothetical protein